MEVGLAVWGLAAELALEEWVERNLACCSSTKGWCCLPAFPFLGPSELFLLLSDPALPLSAI